MEKRWQLKPADPVKTKKLQEALKVHPVLCSLLVQRGITDFEEARSFFRPRLEDLHSPWLFKDMDKAVNRISQAIAQKEKVLIYGDYDVDGTTSVASMYLFLQKIHSQLAYYIPHRYKEGYGVSKAGIDYAIENNFSLIISLDCGIKSVELVQYAKDNGVDFIICDHHLPDDILPNATAILNAKQPDCAYPYKELCGCGVGFKLMCALQEKLELEDNPAFESLDLLATAIAADIVPMTGENRILAYHGLLRANQKPNHGIAALCEQSGLKQELDIQKLVFIIAPRVNAAGRMDEAGKAVELFIAPDRSTALEFATQLHSDNTDRREADRTTTKEALELLNNDPTSNEKKSTVVYQPHWHKGVVGIVASRLTEHYYRPTIVLTKSGDIVAGSARSVAGFNLYEAIHACREHLIGYGGHFAAAGMTLLPDQVIAFREKFESVVAASILPEQLIPEILIDQELRLQDITPNFFSIISQMEPFGPENLRPIFLVKNLLNNGQSKIVKEEHIRFSLKQNSHTITGIGFGMASRFDLLQSGQPIDIVCTLEENHFNNKTTLQLRVMDMRATPA
ncbi:MAG: single-stranded-DNA-specific exonuclease RecJ [Chitinophagaceae bacterium]|nr:single-stranded-DNA-specific exonuclease RecJ [Chitinophagaceae bacterium]